MSDHLTFFDRVNLAHCATKRAELIVSNNERFFNEYYTARQWTKYKCYITKQISFVEYD